MYDLGSLKELVERGGFTCAIAKGDRLFTSTLRGIRPLLDLIESGEDFSGGIAADKIVGRAAALLYARLGIAEVYAGVLGEGGLAVLREHNRAIRHARGANHQPRRHGYLPDGARLRGYIEPERSVFCFKKARRRTRRGKIEMGAVLHEKPALSRAKSDFQSTMRDINPII